jgi:hypothetical protein
MTLIELALFGALSAACPTSIIINSSAEPWSTPDDIAALQRAEAVCAERYKGCVKSIEKIDVRTYSVICKKNIPKPGKPG